MNFVIKICAKNLKFMVIKNEKSSFFKILNFNFFSKLGESGKF